jgi:hypothetical protein
MKVSLVIKYKPAPTSVAAWSNEETGVGASIASGSQGCKKICALFDMEETIKEKPSTFVDNLKLLKDNTPIKYILSVPKKRKDREKANMKKLSPTLLKTTAFKELLFECNFENQKLINRKDTSPIPSQPIKTSKMFSATTRIIINNVKRPR